MPHPLLILGLVLVVLRSEGISSWLGIDGRTLAVSAAIPGCLAVAIMSAIRVRRAAAAFAQQPSRRALAIVGTRTTSGLTSLALVFAIACGTFGWPGHVAELLGDPPALDELASLLPLIVGMVVIWHANSLAQAQLMEMDLLRRIDQGLPVRPLPTPAQLTVERVRVALLAPLVPMLLILAWSERGPDLLSSVLGRTLTAQQATLAQLAGALSVLLVAPRIMLALWPATPLGPGPLRSQLDAMRRLAGVSRVDIRLWRTYTGAVNAAALGVLPGLRAILLTEELVERMRVEQVLGVVLHELSHLRRKHVLWYGLTLLGPGSLIGPTLALVGLPHAATGGLGTALELGLLLGVVGLVSRCFEREADADAAEWLGSVVALPGSDRPGGRPLGVHVMASTLERTAELNGVSLDRFTFTHGTMAQRIASLHQTVDDPRRLSLPRRRGRWVRAAIAIASTATVSLLILP